MKKIALSIIGICFILFAQAQCKPFVKKMIPEMSPFVHNGQMNAQKLNSGETVEAELTFYAGQSYRLFICAEEWVGQFDMQIFDEDDNQIFAKSGKGNLSKDFKVEVTTNLKVKITVPKSNSNTSNGCVAVLVGFKLQPPKGKGGF